MRLARVTGTVTATVKEPSLAGTKLLVIDIEDGLGNVLEPSVVAADASAAGVGDRVLVTTGSAARLSAGAGTLPVDAAIIAVVDHVELAGPTASVSSSKKRKK